MAQLDKSAPATPSVNDPADDPTIGKLAVDVSRNVSLLVRKEIELAKSELKFSVRVGVMGVVLFAAAAFIGVLAIIMLSVAIAYLIHLTGLNLAWCYLIVFAFYLLVAGLLGFLGYRSINKAGPPKRAIAEAKKTQAVLKDRKG
ncbi:hypothetical protein GCM10011519_24240 [Marmoricola endophyticus]|uniref:Phage holin family protein n=1 Tax=Marmoricola endophyticus TaxID=2040280 RepID=A0A917F6U2_9ACTN|nr:phage holin family protein [Marmoricola endophyticus]GGF49438.1 hypothetical protein GCM10011519_24240 [Marmoricola endophyticus]